MTLAPLLLLAQEIAALLVPVKPRPDFRRQLHHSLLAEARRDQALRTLSLPATTPESRWADPQGEVALSLQALHERVIDWSGQAAASDSVDRRWVWGAAAVGSAVSLVGIVAYVLHLRGRQAA